MTNENTTLLKLIAVVCMIIDHVGAALFPRLMWMRVVGRIAFPLFCWCVAVGAGYTRNIWKYALRLLALFVVSQPFYNLALNHTWASPNIFATLLLGLLGIAGIQKKQYWLTAATVLISMFLGADYGLRGVVCILILYALRKYRLPLAAAFTLFCFTWGLSASVTVQVPWIEFIAAWGQGAPYVISTPPIDIPLSWGPASRIMFTISGFPIRLQTLAVMSLPLMLFPMGKRTKLPVPDKLLYWVYPAHLAIIWGVKALRLA